MADKVPTRPRIKQRTAEEDQLQNRENHDGGRCAPGDYPIRKGATGLGVCDRDSNRCWALMRLVGMAGMVCVGLRCPYG